MGLLKNFRSKSRLKDNSAPPLAYSSASPPQRRYGPDLTKRLPDRILTNIFAYVCPHVQDSSYEPCEQSQVGDGCMLCDLRDLAGCAQASRKWYAVAQPLLFTSIRIDAVHYCELEERLAGKRKKAAKPFRAGKSAAEPVEVPNIRLSLLCRTLRERPSLAAQTRLLKIPYMTRETAKGELARTVAVLPNLRYVDLPDGFFTGDASCLGLRQELQARCYDIRKMIYRSGAEDALELLATHRCWQSIETLQLSNLAVEATNLRIVLASLPTLQHLTLSDMPWIDDSIFQSSPGQLPDFPPLYSLKLVETPNLTAQGLQLWLQAPHVQEMLSSLTLQNTGITVPDLHRVLSVAGSLQQLAIMGTVSKSLGLSTHQLPPIASNSLKTLHFEITNSEEAHGLQKPAESYYLYLSSSLHQSALPALNTLYVRDETFPELLVLPSILAPFANGSGRESPQLQPGRLSLIPPNHSTQPNGGGFNQTLEVFSKGIDELEWVFTAIAPTVPSNSRNSSLTGGRPLSAYSASRGLGPQWAQGGFGGEARKSVMVGNGFGGFLAVPQEDAPRPRSADGSRGNVSNGSPEGYRSSFLKSPPALGGSGVHDRKSSRHDLWR